MSALPPLDLNVLGGLAHELRTPLGAIGGFTELLDLGVHGALTQAQRDGIRRIQANQQLMVSLIDTFMAYAEVASGQVELEFAVTDAGDVVRDAIDAFEPIASSRAITVRLWEAAPGSDPEALRIRTDRARFRQIVGELLHDAAGNAPDGATLGLFLSANAGGVSLHFAGPGAAFDEGTSEPQFLAFDRRAKGSRPSAARHALSLPLARALARAMGGEVAPDTGEALAADVGSRKVVLTLPND